MPEQQRRHVPATAAETTAEHPWPLRLLSMKIGGVVATMPVVWVEGQVVQLTRRPGTRTDYLTLRDADADLSMSVSAPRRVLDALPVPLAEGARVVVRARPTYWDKRGSLSLLAEVIRPVGVGELLARIEHLKQLLASEGVFDARRKRPLPFLPRVVGLVCGRGSAAERDVVENARRRWPAVRFSLREVPVQGPDAVTEVSRALTELDAEDEVDVIVVARGGGSLEDLLPFSNEALVRAVAACTTPVVSAIGHEVDAPLIDLVADHRASTPTDAAKAVVPDVAEQTARVQQARARLRRSIAARVERERRSLTQVMSRPVMADPGWIVADRADELIELLTRSRRCLHHRLDRERDAVTHLRAQVRSLSPAATLQRGYAVVQTADGHVVRGPQDVAAGDTLRLRLDGGDVAARVEDSLGSSS